jgi:hypothetical protein
MVNACFAQMADFALGWAGIDFAGDDGRKFGLWPWQMDDGTTEAPAREGSKRPKEERRKQQEGTDAGRRTRRAPPAPIDPKKPLPQLDGFP